MLLVPRLAWLDKLTYYHDLCGLSPDVDFAQPMWSSGNEVGSTRLVGGQMTGVLLLFMDTEIVLFKNIERMKTISCVPLPTQPDLLSLSHALCSTSFSTKIRTTSRLIKVIPHPAMRERGICITLDIRRAAINRRRDTIAASIITINRAIPRTPALEPTGATANIAVPVVPAVVV